MPCLLLTLLVGGCPSDSVQFPDQTAPSISVSPLAGPAGALVEIRATDGRWAVQGATVWFDDRQVDPIWTFSNGLVVLIPPGPDGSYLLEVRSPGLQEGEQVVFDRRISSATPLAHGAWLAWLGELLPRISELEAEHHAALRPGPLAGQDFNGAVSPDAALDVLSVAASLLLTAPDDAVAEPAPFVPPCAALNEDAPTIIDESGARPGTYGRSRILQMTSVLLDALAVQAEGHARSLLISDHTRLAVATALGSFALRVGASALRIRVPVHVRAAWVAAHDGTSVDALALGETRLASVEALLAAGAGPADLDLDLESHWAQVFSQPAWSAWVAGYLPLVLSELGRQTGQGADGANSPLAGPVRQALVVNPGSGGQESELLLLSGLLQVDPDRVDACLSRFFSSATRTAANDSLRSAASGGGAIAISKHPSGVVLSGDRVGETSLLFSMPTAAAPWRIPTVGGPLRPNASAPADWQAIVEVTPGR